MVFAYSVAAVEKGLENLKPFRYPVRELRPLDVHIKVKYCGICHSDIHKVNDEWAPLDPTRYPLVPGHEMTGIVSAVGSDVTKVKLGDTVGVGCMVNSCRKCENCCDDFEQYCDKTIFTYNNVEPEDKRVTRGGYSTDIVVNEHFVIIMPKDYPLDAGAPLLCAGITTYAPFKEFGYCDPSKPMKIGLIGLGGLGHMVLQWGKAFGHTMYVFSRGTKKEALARELGADVLVDTCVENWHQKYESIVDVMMDTICGHDDFAKYLHCVGMRGDFVLIGLPAGPVNIDVRQLIFKNIRLLPSMIGGIKWTQEMVDFAAKHNVKPLVEVIPLDALEIQKAYRRCSTSDVKFRFSIDCEKSPTETTEGLVTSES